MGSVTASKMRKAKNSEPTLDARKRVSVAPGLTGSSASLSAH